jgi:hypothetical protein
MADREIIQQILEHYKLLIRLANGKTIYQLQDGKRLRVSLRSVVKSECEAAIRKIKEATCAE